MFLKEYLFDSNIVINIWRNHPRLFESIESSKEVDFKLSSAVAEELSRKEYSNYKGVPVLSNKFIKLLGHVFEYDYRSSMSLENVKKDSNNRNYYINGNKLSIIDMNLIQICKDNDNFILVTEDRRLSDSAKVLLESSKVLNYKEFLEDISKYIPIE